MRRHARGDTYAGMAHFLPADLAELRDAVAEALAVGEPVEMVGGGSKRALGRPLQTPHLLDLSLLSGIRDYAPSELVLTAGAATPLAEIERALAECGQMLAFEPPDWRALLGQDGEPTASQPWAARSPATCRGRGGSRRGRRATISSGFAASAAAAKFSRPAARSSRTSPATIFAS